MVDLVADAKGQVTSRPQVIFTYSACFPTKTKKSQKSFDKIRKIILNYTKFWICFFYETAWTAARTCSVASRKSTLKTFKQGNFTKT